MVVAGEVEEGRWEEQREGTEVGLGKWVEGWPAELEEHHQCLVWQVQQEDVVVHQSAGWSDQVLARKE